MIGERELLAGRAAEEGGRAATGGGGGGATAEGAAKGGGGGCGSAATVAAFAAAGGCVWSFGHGARLIFGTTFAPCTASFFACRKYNVWFHFLFFRNIYEFF